MNDQQVKIIEDLLSRSELDGSSQELMRQFFNTIADQPQFDKIADLLNRFPSLFENFCKCFMLKKEFLDQGHNENEWNDFLETEQQVLNKLDNVE